MKMVFNGTHSQIVTELGKCFDPKCVYELSESELVILGNRKFLELFSAIQETTVEKKKGKSDV